MWYQDAFIYQIYPLGLCGAPLQNDGVAANRLAVITDEWLDHIRSLGTTAVLFNPLLESDAHGYDTRDFYRVDTRLGTNADLSDLCRRIHERGMKVLFDGVFNHVGRGFWAFRDVQEKRWDSPYKDWFRISFDGNSGYNDGFWYEGWEGHYELVKLNLYNGDVRRHLFDAIRAWVNEFDIDGLRLDVAYSLPAEFLSELRRTTDSIKPDFWLLGETLHGDYNRFMNDNACHSVTNYECYKGLYSSFNAANMHEIGYSLHRQFGPDHWCLYTGKSLLSFVDNHDVSRIASQLENAAHLPLIYGMIFGMPGVPAVYYGSEWGLKAAKSDGDPALRPHIARPEANDLTAFIAALAKARAASPALRRGSYRQLLVQPNQLIFEREADGERVIVAVNAANTPFAAHFDARAGRAVDLITGETHDFGGGSELPPYSVAFWKTER